MDTIKAAQRHFSDFGWLQTYWLFSFSDYFDPNNMQFGALRVFNDDVVASGKGFPMHPHREMEIITIVLDGEITHEDSMGNRAVVKAGDVQRMSAGTGLRHSEYNLADTPLHLYQIWILPDQDVLEPSYDQKTFDPADWHNTLLPVASGQGADGAVSFHTDASIYRSSLDKGQSVTHELADGRGAFLYVARGEIDVNGTLVSESDQARIVEQGSITMAADEDTEFILIDVKV